MTGVTCSACGVQIPTLTAVGISYWTASLPIAAGISQRLQANAGPDVGAGSVTSIDGDDLIPGEPLISQIKVSSFISGKKRRSGNNDSDRPRFGPCLLANQGWAGYQQPNAVDPIPWSSERGQVAES